MNRRTWSSIKTYPSTSTQPIQFTVVHGFSTCCTFFSPFSSPSPCGHAGSARGTGAAPPLEPTCRATAACRRRPQRSGPPRRTPTTKRCLGNSAEHGSEMIWKVKLMIADEVGWGHVPPARSGTRLDYANGNKQESCGKQLGGREKTSGRRRGWAWSPWNQNGTLHYTSLFIVGLGAHNFRRDGLDFRGTFAFFLLTCFWTFKLCTVRKPHGGWFCPWCSCFSVRLLLLEKSIATVQSSCIPNIHLPSVFIPVYKCCQSSESSVLDLQCSPNYTKCAFKGNQ